MKFCASKDTIKTIEDHATKWKEKFTTVYQSNNSYAEFKRTTDQWEKTAY